MKPLLMCVLVGASLQAASGQATDAPSPTPQTHQAEIQELREQLKAIAQRLNTLEAEEASANSVKPAAAPVAVVAAPAPVLTEADQTTLKFFRGTTLNFAIDGYYEYNFNQPQGRVNLLRAYDVSSNSFSLNQANIVVEHLPVAESGQRFGGRLDLQFGQATETLQGSSANEQRPQVWRNLFQAYGSYLAPIGTGLNVDFGKFASALGVEGNYTKDQLNYSRSYLFNFLPFYHMGFRTNYNVTPKLNVAYWLVNGAQQTEDFNGFKSQAFLFTLKPAKTLTWNINYYFGQEQRDVLATLNPGQPTSPTQPGLPTTSITPAPNGREHIFDTYATWTPNAKLTLVGEADYVINRNEQQSAPAHVTAGAAYARYALPHNWAAAARAEYLSDRGGLFSGRTQALKETTFTLDHNFEPGFLTRFEYRRDFSNQRFFLTDQPNVLSNAQSTATLGLIYSWGMKQGNW